MCVASAPIFARLKPLKLRQKLEGLDDLPLQVSQGITKSLGKEPFHSIAWMIYDYCKLLEPLTCFFRLHTQIGSATLIDVSVRGGSPRLISIKRGNHLLTKTSESDV